MTTGNLQIHSQNILPIIKKWLYSDKDIFVRELVANACDAIHKLKILRDKGESSALDAEFRIEVHVDKKARTLKFIDTGIGMTAAEVEKYIAQIAFSGAEEFVEKYQTNQEQDQIIGHFGLGFYSAYMVADKVNINTLSYREGEASAYWSCDGSPQYELDVGSKPSRGTEITLHINDESDEYLEEANLRGILNRYCAFLPYPIYLNDTLINSKQPLWTKPPSECNKNDYIEFYRHLYPMEEDPLLWVHLNVDYPFHLKGILYFPKLQRNLDPRLESIKLYCNRVFVADNCKDIIPDYLMVLRGVIDSPDIPLNVSRSSLQRDKTVSQLSGHISKKVADSLSSLYTTDRDRFIQCWKDIEIIIKLGVIEDEKFYTRVKDFLVWQNTDGEWVTINDYLERNKDKTRGKVFYTSDDKHGFEFLKIYRDNGIEVLHTNPLIDAMLISFLESKVENLKFQRIDGGINDIILDNSREKTILDADGKTEAGKLADFVRLRLDEKEVEVEARSLASNNLAGFVMIDEQQRRVRDYLRKIDSASGQLPRGVGKHSFIVNTNSPLMNSLPKLCDHDAHLAKDIIKEIYQLSLLSQREIEPNQLDEFIQRTTNVLERLTQKFVT